MKLATPRMWILLAASVLTGCVGLQTQPRPEILAKMNHIHVVPMEVRPLSVDLGYATTGSASMVHFLPRYTIGMARAVGVLSGIAVLLELSELSRRQIQYPPAIQSQLGPTDAWSPTVELAQEAKQLLIASGKRSNVSAEIRPVPGIEHRGRTVLMENWMAPIRAWYNDVAPTPGYAALASQGGEAVLEMGISNYEIFNGKLLLQVHVKLIDAASGHLLGRARSSSYTQLPPMDEAFAAEAKRFKEAVTRAGNSMVLSCLQVLGVVTK